MDNQRFGIGYVGQVGKEFQVINEFCSRCFAPFYTKGKYGACTFGEIFIGKRLVFASFEVRLIHPGNFGMTDQKVNHFAGIFHVSLHA